MSAAEKRLRLLLRRKGESLLERRESADLARVLKDNERMRNALLISKVQLEVCGHAAAARCDYCREAYEIVMEALALKPERAKKVRR